MQPEECDALQTRCFVFDFLDRLGMYSVFLYTECRMRFYLQCVAVFGTRHLISAFEPWLLTLELGFVPSWLPLTAPPALPPKSVMPSWGLEEVT